MITVNEVIDNYDNIVLYGSTADIKNNFRYNDFSRDIDIYIVTNNCEKHNHIGEHDNVEYQYISYDEYRNLIHSANPNLLTSYTDNITLSLLFEKFIKEIPDDKVRRSISLTADQAYNKGKKKLIKADDYDEYLGIKNIYHSIRIPQIVMKRLKNIDFKYDLDNLWDELFKIYHASTGTLEERWKVLDDYAKKIYLTNMTLFRSVFPKDTN